jgi:integrase/recombinase XerD
MFRRFLKYIHPIPLHKVTKTHIIEYHLWLIKECDIAISYQNQSINALKFYIEKVLLYPASRYDLPRPIKQKTLPKVLSVEEVVNYSNPKYKAQGYFVTNLWGRTSHFRMCSNATCGY